MKPGPSHLGLAAVLALAVATRLAVMIPVARRPPDDPDNYLPLARSLAEGRGLTFKGRPTAYRPPLYPLLLAPMVAAFGDGPTEAILGLHLALGVGTVALTARTARRWGLSPPQVLAAAAIVACDPVLVVQGRSAMTETLAAFLLTAALAALAEPSARGVLLGGLGFGLSALCRPSTLAGAVLATIALVLTDSSPPTRRVGRALLLVLTTVAPLVPWAWRNARLFGEPVWTTTHGGYTLALANNPSYYAEVLDGPPGATWSLESQSRWAHANNLATGSMAEPRADRYLRTAALRLAAERPRQFLRASFARLGRFWGVAPAVAVYSGPLRLAVAAWTVPFWIVLAVGASRRATRRWPRSSALALALALTAVHAVFWTDLRMRAPIVPALALIAASALPAGKTHGNPNGSA